MVFFEGFILKELFIMEILTLFLDSAEILLIECESVTNLFFKSINIFFWVR